jgi:hypothetical protein
MIVSAGMTDARPDKLESGEVCRRYWIGRVQFPGKESFIFGTIEGKQDLTLQQAMPLFIELLDKHFPTRPNILRMSSGRIYTMLDKDQTI